MDACHKCQADVQMPQSHTHTHTHTHMDRHTNLVVSLLSLVVVYFTKWVGWCRIRVSLQCVFHRGYTLLITAVFCVCVWVSVREAESRDTLEQCVWEVHRERWGPSLNRGNTCLREKGEKTWPSPFVMFLICLPLNTFFFHSLSPPTHMHSRIYTYCAHTFLNNDNHVSQSANELPVLKGFTNKSAPNVILPVAHFNSKKLFFLKSPCRF